MSICGLIKNGDFVPFEAHFDGDFVPFKFIMC